MSTGCNTYQYTVCGNTYEYTDKDVTESGFATRELYEDFERSQWGLDGSHIVDNPKWKVVDLERTSLTQVPLSLKRKFIVDARRMDSSGDRPWIDLGVNILELCATCEESYAVIYNLSTLRTMDSFRIFGGMQAGRFQNTVIVVAIKDGKVVTYAFRTETRDEAINLFRYIGSKDYFQYELRPLVNVPQDLKDTIHKLLSDRLKRWTECKELRKSKGISPWTAEREALLARAKAQVKHDETERDLVSSILTL